ncbi:MAG: replication-associated recombination protein A, partial [Steroidobacteraceae bacterium]
VLHRLDDAALERLLARAEAAEGRVLPLRPEARTALRAMADGDGRYVLNMAEQLFALPADTAPLDPAALASLLARRPALYDRDREEHYNVSYPTFVGEGASQINGLLSAFHKACRGSDPDAALYYAARMMVFGPETGPTVFRRLACVASEDVGMADPQALVQVLTAWQVFERVGWPEGRLMLSQAVLYVATAPKSNSGVMAVDAALAAAEQTRSLSPPLHILNAPTRLMKELGYHHGYQYDHDQPEAYAGQEFFPEPLTGARRPELYRPNERGFEREIRKRLAYWAALREHRRR